ncbi:hypothetical protein GXW83_27510 [Streptacidiphilus sp. PB12-B1b]|uniref:hypothetical protein n=1 Tax=Streptacidiphilus sp. PB12-B1b TaxID=2705012 RepID=UPI0015FC12D4|nr:hypothetical protein [Streptacidiphilus sp. PB12-B1b]QMU78893.1 hypothetical protein GXW83_27510 [Streptacidiphilus sp. PB12-B1b]
MDDEDRKRLARSAEARVQALVEAARRRAELQRQGRDEFAASRTAGLRARYSAKQARNRLTARHGRRSS